MKKFIEWINREIEDIELVKCEDNLFIFGRHSEAVRIRAMLYRFFSKEDHLERIKTAICHNYCKFQDIYPEYLHEKMTEEKCKECPLNEITQYLIEEEDSE